MLHMSVPWLIVIACIQMLDSHTSGTLGMQDAEAFHQSLLHPSAWYKLKDGSSQDH